MQTGTITHYIDPEVETLKREIVLLEDEIVTLENEKAECERVVQIFTLRMQEEVGETLEAILRIKRDYAERHREEGEFQEEEYREAERRYQTYESQREYARKEEKASFDISEDDRTTLKRLYRESALLCHPDRVENGKKSEATKYFARLSEAYRRQDIETVHAIYEELKRNTTPSDTRDAIHDKNALIQRHHELSNRRDILIVEIQTLKASDGWKISTGDTPLDDYLRDLAEKLEKELVSVKNLYE